MALCIRAPARQTGMHPPGRHLQHLPCEATVSHDAHCQPCMCDTRVVDCMALLPCRDTERVRWVAGADEAAVSLASGLDPGFSQRDATDFTLAIVGDLHLERRGAEAFARARQQLRQLLVQGPSSRVVQLGDLGGYNDQPGELLCRTWC